MKRVLFVLISTTLMLLGQSQVSISGDVGLSSRTNLVTAGLSVDYRYGPIFIGSGMKAHVPVRGGAFFQQKLGVEIWRISVYTGPSYHFFSAEQNKTMPPNGWHMNTGLRYKEHFAYQECYGCEIDTRGYWGAELQQDGRYTFFSLLVGVTL